METPQKTGEKKTKIKTIFLDEYRQMIRELIRIRKSLKISQVEVSKQVGWANHSYLSKIETFEKRLDVVELAILAKIYKKTPAYFIKYLK
jgi:transcriptional regulator with XRE-family HTH domain